jgi:tetratricopeptide (TPR) repeat protein
MTFLVIGFAQNSKKTYAELKSLYQNFDEHNSEALPFVEDYLKKAKQEKNYAKILQAYKDIIFYTADREMKLLYADSSIYYSLQSKDDELLSDAYLGKGILYYFFFRDYQSALNEYLKAHDYSKNIKNLYLKHKIFYHIGAVKSYLGNYNDALELFDECISYFEPLSKDEKAHVNVIFNNQKGYLNSLHQKIVCHQELKHQQQTDSLLTIAFSVLPKDEEFALEKSYLLKSKGISDYYKGNYLAAINNLKTALPELQKNDDFNWASVCYFYLGKSYSKINNEEQAIPYFIKVDSIFQKQVFIHPELRENYEFLIDFYKLNNPKKELFYTQQLIKADKILHKDFKYLYSKIHKEYDTKTLLERQKQLETEKNVHSNLLKISIVLIASLLLFLLYKKKKDRQIQKKYYELKEHREKQISQEENKNTMPQFAYKENKTELPNDIIQDLLLKLDNFEQKKEFLQKGLTQSELAKRFTTNTTYLSIIINNYKNRNFNTYLNELRINHITNLLYENSKYFDYTIEGLTKEC